VSANAFALIHLLTPEVEYSATYLGTSADVTVGWLRRGVQITAKEQAELAYNREVLRLAKERLADLAEVTANDGYHMPDQYDGDRPQQSKRYELLTQRYRREA
jgi:hypothetical protein